MALATVPEIVAELKAGRMVVLVDEEDRENEGDLVVAAQFVTPETINFMAKNARGLVCLTSRKSTAGDWGWGPWWPPTARVTAPTSRHRSKPPRA
jgi:3,4-dihydroxy-2-butanone 4-phosphate synthase